MVRLLWNELTRLRGRAAALGTAILVATVSFVLLTSAVSTGTLRVSETVAKNWRAAYDILVRPTDSFASLEREEGLVRENYLSGIFGGITVGQWREIRRIPGVSVAAPVANIGYIIPASLERIVINPYLNEDRVQLYRLRLSWTSDRGLSRYPGGVLYVYDTGAHRFRAIPSQPGGFYEIVEVIPGSKPARVCPFSFLESLPRRTRTPVGWTSQASSFLQCFSSRSPAVARRNLYAFPPGDVGTTTDAFFPMLLSAVDPVQEQRLVGLGSTVVDGRYLLETDHAVGRTNKVTIPVIASDRTYVDQALEIGVERLSIPRGMDVPRLLASKRAFPVLSRLAGRVVGREKRGAQSAYEDLLEQFSTSQHGRVQHGFDSFWTVSSVSYQVAGDRLTPKIVSNPDSVWRHPGHRPFFPAPPGSQDVHFRGLEIHPFHCFAGKACLGGGALRLVGRYDPGRLPGFGSPLTRVPLESYYPPQAQPGDQATGDVLGGRPLLPTMNLGGYVTQPPFMFTTLEAARTFLPYFEGADADAPISVIRVRIAGVTGPDELSRERIRAVAEQIRERTGLAVDVTAGSSPTPMTVDLAAGEFGRPSLTLREGWVKKGVSVAILDAVDRKSLVLFVLVLVSSGLFLANGALASARARRTDIGTLLCLGWSRGEVFRLVLAGVGLVGLVAGLVGTALAAGLVGLLSLNMPAARVLLVPPVAVVIALLAGIAPAWRSSRLTPLDAVRSLVSERGLRHRVRTTSLFVVANLRRVPGRTLLGAAGLFVGVASLTLLLAVNLAFQGILVGTLLGDAVSIQMRGVDLLSVVLVIALGGAAVADVLFLNLRERAPELASLRATGWERRELSVTIALEGAGIGLVGSVPGALVGVLLAWTLATPDSGVVVAGVLAAAVGVVVAVAFSLVPAMLVNRLSPASVLAEEP
jgi:putative ABC transport system permease protein